MDKKRISARAIIIFDGKLMAMYREKDGRVYYTFPGGEKEPDESEEECVKREVLEEFGIVVEPIKKVYVYQSQRSIEHFYLAKWISGEFGTGKGEEFQPNRNGGVYIPKLVNIAELKNLPLMPPEVASAFCKDYSQNGDQEYEKVLGQKVISSLNAKNKNLPEIKSDDK